MTVNYEEKSFVEQALTYVVYYQLNKIMYKKTKYI